MPGVGRGERRLCSLPSPPPHVRDGQGKDAHAWLRCPPKVCWEGCSEADAVNSTKDGALREGPRGHRCRDEKGCGLRGCHWGPALPGRAAQVGQGASSRDGETDVGLPGKRWRQGKNGEM